MTHPGIEFVENYGYLEDKVKQNKAIGVCLFCGSDIIHSRSGYVKSFDGIFCNQECCHSYYEIENVD